MEIIYVVKLFLFFTLVLFVLFVLGSLFSKIVFKKFLPFEGNIFLSIAFNSLTFYLVLSSISAIFLTSGKTLQWLVLFSIIGIWIKLRKEFFLLNSKVDFEKKIKTAEYFAIFISIIISFFFIFYVNGSPTSRIDITVYFDYYYYAKLSGKLINIGVENPLILLSNYIEVENISLYHFTDLWFSGLVFKVLDLNEIESLMFVNYPILLFLTIISSIGVLFNGKKSSLFLILLSILILWGSSVGLPFLENSFYKQSFFRFQGGPGLNLMQTKTLIIYPLVIFSFYFIKKKEYTGFLLFSIIAMTAYNTIIPAFAGGILLVSIYLIARKYFKKDKFKKRVEVFKFFGFSLSLFLIIGFIGIILFRLIHLQFGILELHFKSIVIIFIESMIGPWLVYWILAIVLFINFISNKQFQNNFEFIVFLFGAQVAASLFVLVFHNTGNVSQALSNPLPVFFIIISLFFIQLIWNHKIVRVILIATLFISFFFNIRNRAENQVVFIPQKNKEYSVVFKNEIIKEFELNSGSGSWIKLGITKSPYFHYPWVGSGFFIFSTSSSDFPLDVSGYLAKEDQNWCDLGNNHLSPLCIIEENLSHLTPEEVFVKFLKEGPATFLYAESPELIPIEALFHLELIAKDPKTGEAFYSILKEKK